MTHTFSVDSQNLEIGSDDTSNDFSEVPDTEFLPSERDHDDYRGLNDFVDLTKQLEARRMANAEVEHRMVLSSIAESVIEQNIEHNFEEHEETSMNRYFRSQEEEMAAMDGRLTAPQDEVRKRRPRTNTSNKNDLLVEELRAKQLTLVDEQIYLHKIQQESAFISQEKSKEELALMKTRRKIAAIELKEKQENAQTNKEEAQERLQLTRLQRQIAEIELQKKQNEL